MHHLLFSSFGVMVFDGSVEVLTAVEILTAVMIATVRTKMEVMKAAVTARATLAQ